MKILHIGNALGGGGAEKVFADSLELLRQESVDEHLCATCSSLFSHPRIKPELDFLSWTAKRGIRRLDYLYSMENALKLADFLNAERPDLIHLHGFLAHLSPSILRIISHHRDTTDLRVVQTVHSHELICANASAYDWKQERPCTDCMGQSMKLKIFHRNCDRRGLAVSWMKGVRHIIYRNILQHPLLVDRYVCPSEFVRETLVNEGLDPSHISVVRNPVVITADLNTSEREHAIVYFGRFGREKRIPFLIKAFENLSRSNPGLQLWLIGDGEDRLRIEQLMNSSPAGKNISLFGFMESIDLIRTASRAKVMVNASTALETFSMVIPEAIAMGCLPVVADLGAMREMIDLLGCGFVFDPHDQQSLIDGVQQALDNYSNLIPDVTAAQLRASEVLGGDAYVQGIHNVYTSATG